ncbi:unnamed protein product [Caenorhabditis brenneri]
MPLSRPAKFPLLKLPWLCIDCIIKGCDIFDLIFFALISKRTRRTVRSSKIPLSGIKLCLLKQKWIELDMCKMWNFENSLKWCFDRNSREHPLVLEKNTIPLYTSRTNDALKSYTHGNTMNASKIVMEFLTDVFKCSIEHVSIGVGNIPVSGDIGVKSTINLSIGNAYGYAQSQKLNLLLENMEVTGTCNFCVNPPFGLSSTKKGFYVDPKLFKCQQLVFWSGSAAWVTREILLQFEVPRLNFYYCPFSAEDILSFVTNWFHSYNKKLEYLCIETCGQISSENFQTQELNSVPFSGRNRIPPSESFNGIDFSEGLEVVRHDGLQATIHATGGVFVFYIWHD